MYVCTQIYAELRSWTQLILKPTNGHDPDSVPFTYHPHGPIIHINILLPFIFWSTVRSLSKTFPHQISVLISVTPCSLTSGMVSNSEIQIFPTVSWVVSCRDVTEPKCCTYFLRSGICYMHHPSDPSHLGTLQITLRYLNHLSHPCPMLIITHPLVKRLKYSKRCISWPLPSPKDAGGKFIACFPYSQVVHFRLPKDQVVVKEKVKFSLCFIITK
jgi:hypothetical protein